MREASYTSLRLGLYDPIKTIIQGADKEISIAGKFLAGGIAGGIGSLAGNPFDVLKTKMMANVESSEGVKYFANDIYKSQGYAGFYKGL